MKKSLLLLLSALFSMLFIGISFAKDDAMMWAPMNSDWMHSQMPQLTDEQKSQLDALKEEFYANMKEKFEELKNAETEEEKAAIREEFETYL